MYLSAKLLIQFGTFLLVAIICPDCSLANPRSPELFISQEQPQKRILIRDKCLGPAKNEVLALSQSHANEGHKDSLVCNVLILHVIRIHIYKYLPVIQIIWKRGIKEISTILNILFFLVYKVINILSIINFIILSKIQTTGKAEN